MAKIVWITGCTRGLGRSMAQEFRGLGWKVVGCGRSEGGADGVDFYGACDVSDDAQVAGFCSAAVEAVGAPDLLVNNAALMNDPAPLWEVPAEQFDALTAVNINGVANVIRHAVPSMLEKGSGVIVNLSSGWGRSTSSEVAPYCATKWAIEGLTQALAQELPSGLAAVALNPGVIDTDMLRQAWDEAAGAHGMPEEWAVTAVPFLAGLGVEDNGRALTAP